MYDERIVFIPVAEMTCDELQHVIIRLHLRIQHIVFHYGKTHELHHPFALHIHIFFYRLYVKYDRITVHQRDPAARPEPQYYITQYLSLLVFVTRKENLVDTPEII